ncbi:ABC transporter [Gordoniibacillus kamchatkensis]|uniref:ABC transporter n=1 Tax=Gordoniibacillus kamchatkensis TaxID=1590651 RepID=A0ABR5A9Z3_9BACL|nr:GldG family protein [Paenibacillus sp. VKM B-2647]KIL37839.1 ABC transporter [Paenibacillus sp. VKM B-2647]
MNKWIKRSNAVVLSLAAIGIFIVLTLFLHSVKGFQLDLTKNKNFSLSEQTISTLKNLNQDVKIIAFTNPSSADPFITRQVSDLANEYKQRSSHITFEEHDILKEPSVAQQYQITDGSGVVLFISGDNRKEVSYYQMFNSQQDGSYSFSGEAQFTQALISLTSKTKHPVYFLSGHGEIPLSQMNVFQSALEGSNYEVKDLNLLRDGKIPDDAEILFIVGPQTDLSDKEAQLVGDYLKNKGRLFFSFGFNKDMATSWKNIDSLLNTYGIQDQHAIAIDTSRTSLGDPLTIVPEFGSHEITDKLQANGLLTLITQAITMKNDPNNATYDASVLLKSTDKAYGETNIADLLKSKTTNDANDIKGPLNLAYAVSTKDGSKPKAIVIGGFSFLHDQVIGQQGNRDFALNSVNWLDEQKDQVTIRPRQGDAYQQVTLMPSQANTIFIFTIVLLPLLFLLIGGWIWWRRRKG